jgi:tetratricopeptide (TPR) repeat protein
VSQRDAITWSLGIFALALAIRAVALWQLAGSVLLDTLIGDAINYDQWARELAGGDWLGDEVYFQAPLYPHFMAVVYRLFDDGPFAVRCVQIVLGAGSCALLALTGWRWISPAAGIAAGLLLAIYTPAIFGDLGIQKAGVSSFFVCLVLFLLSGVVEQPKPARLAVLGLATGALALTRENALIFVVVLAPWLALRPGGHRVRAIGGAALFVVGFALVLLPVAVRNWHVGGELHLTTSQFGANFYVGNNPSTDGTYQPLVPRRGDPRVERQDVIDLAERAAGRELTPAEVSRWYTDRALEYIRSQPGDWVALLARKLALSFNAVELVDSKDQYSHADLSVVMAMGGALLHFGVLAPLAALGVWVTWPRRARLLPLYLLFAAYTASMLLFYVFARYRVPLIPILTLFAAAGIVGLPHFARSRPRGELAACLGLTAAVGIFCNWPLSDPDYMRSVTHYNLGNELAAVGEVDAAMSRYRLAISLHDGNAMANHNLGALLARSGDLAGARLRYERALEIAPAYAGARTGLAATHEELGRSDLARGEDARALEHFRRALELDPNRPALRQELMRLHGAGDPAEPGGEPVAP